MDRSSTSLLRLFCLVCFPLALASGADSHWIRMQSANFDVYSTASVKNTRESLQHFEQVRRFFEQGMGSRAVDSSPVRIVIFGSQKEYAPYRPNNSAIAYYQQNGEKEAIVLSSTGEDAFPIAVHEYVHLVVRRANLKLPTWLNEGLAELYSTLRPAGAKVVVGGLIEGRFRELQSDPWVPLATILAVDQKSPFYNEKEQAGSFYNESWGLTHMLALSPDYRQKFPQFLNAMQTGTGSAEALTRVYGKPLAAIENDLQDYLHGFRFAAVVLPLDVGTGKEGAQAVPAPMFDVKVILADLNNRPGNELETREILQALSREEPKRPEPFSELGYLAWRMGANEEARKEFAKAFELGDRDPRLLWDYGRLAENNAPEESVRAFTELLKLEPGRADARIELIAAQFKTSQPKEARATIPPSVQPLPVERPLPVDLAAPHAAPAARLSIEGIFVMLDCDGVQAKAIVETAGGTKVFLVEDPGQITIQGGERRELSCGLQKRARVRMEYEAPGDTQSGVDGLLRLIQFE